MPKIDDPEEFVIALGFAIFLACCGIALVVAVVADAFF